MATKTEFETALRSRVAKMLPALRLSSPGASRPIYRYTIVKLIDGEPVEGHVDIAVYDEGKAGELTVKLSTNREPEAPDKTFLNTVESWLAANASARNIIAWRIVSSGPKRVVLDLDREDPATKSAKVERWMVAERPDGTIFRGPLIEAA